MELLDDVRQREDTGKLKTKHLIAPCGTLSLEEAVYRRKTDCGMNHSPTLVEFSQPVRRPH